MFNKKQVKKAAQMHKKMDMFDFCMVNEQFHDYGLHIPTRSIYFGSANYDMEWGETGVDFASAQEFIKNMHILESYSNDPITIIFNSPGGDWTHGMSMFDSINNSPCQTIFKGHSTVRSMGSIIIQAADVRLLHKHADFMIHDGYLFASGEHKTVVENVRWAERDRFTMYEIYYDALKEKYFLDVPKETALKEIEHWCAHDKFFSCETALMLGFIDGIIGDDE